MYVLRTKDLLRKMFINIISTKQILTVPICSTQSASTHTKTIHTPCACVLRPASFHQFIRPNAYHVVHAAAACVCCVFNVVPGRLWPDRVLLVFERCIGGGGQAVHRNTQLQTCMYFANANRISRIPHPKPHWMDKQAHDNPLASFAEIKRE